MVAGKFRSGVKQAVTGNQESDLSGFLISWILTYHDHHKLIRDAVKTGFNTGILGVPKKKKLEQCIPYSNYSELDAAWSRKLREEANTEAGGSGGGTSAAAAASGGHSASAHSGGPTLLKRPRSDLAALSVERPEKQGRRGHTESVAPSRVPDTEDCSASFSEPASNDGDSRLSGSRLSQSLYAAPDRVKPKEPTVRTLRELQVTQPQRWDRVDKDAIREEAIKRCRVRRDTITVTLMQFHIEKPGKDNWLPYQVRPLNEHFVNLLSEKLLARKQPGHNIFVVLVDPEEGLEGPKDFDISKVNQYKYYVLGGNHTAAAKMKAYKKFSIPNEAFLLCSCFVYVGLTLLEARIIATDDNADQQFRLKMSHIQKVEYWHQRYLEEGCIRTQAFKEQLAAEALPIKPGSDLKKTTRAADNYFQIAFRTGELWMMQQKVFTAWEEGKISGQRTGRQLWDPTSIPEMKWSYFRYLQGVPDDVIISVLQRVLDGQLPIEELGFEVTRHKILRIMNAVMCKELGVKDFSEAQRLYPVHATEQRIHGHFTEFSQLLVSLSTSLCQVCGHKTNVRHAGGPRINHIHEHITIGYWNNQGKRSPVNFNTVLDEAGNRRMLSSVLSCGAVSAKLKHPGDGAPVNIYQKPQRLISTLISHLSREYDWVLDLCAGSGTTIACAVKLLRNCGAVELDRRQSFYIPQRIRSLDTLPSPDVEITTVGYHKEPIPGESATTHGELAQVVTNRHAASKASASAAVSAQAEHAPIPDDSSEPDEDLAVVALEGREGQSGGSPLVTSVE
ncbi:hypothetical protein R1sor_003872 [Riccia sorocarpa]|uniref:DNA methylase N-4/N-6 domain-containing protein n=1 Tax=Riccia sorocarpa TaxID=122646 RepID=A0ABD3H6D7_9MARC